jgi:hypothetical protein
LEDSFDSFLFAPKARLSFFPFAASRTGSIPGVKECWGIKGWGIGGVAFESPLPIGRVSNDDEQTAAASGVGWLEEEKEGTRDLSPTEGMYGLEDTAFPGV